MANFARLSVSIDEKQLERLKRRAEAEGSDVSAIVRSALDWWEVTGGNFAVVEEIAQKVVKKHLHRVAVQFSRVRKPAS